MKKILIPLNLFFTFNKKLLLTFTTFFVLLSCTSNDDESSSSFTPQNIPFTLIGKSYMIEPTNISQQNTIITNQTQWNNLLNQMDSNSNVSNSFTTTIIDFSLYNLIVVIDIVRPNLSYSININSITENQNNIVVDILSSGSVNGFNAGSIPFHIVKIPIQSKPFVFQ